MPDHYPNTTNKGISASKFMDGSPALGKESNVGKLANITRRVTIRVGKVEKVSALNAEKITKLKNITQLRKENVDKKISGSSSGLLDALNGINDNITGMMSILIEQQKFDRKKAENERKESEKARRGAKVLLMAVPKTFTPTAPAFAPAPAATEAFPNNPTPLAALPALPPN